MWLSWLKTLQTELQHIHLERVLWRELTEAIQQTVPEGTPGTWFWHYVRLYTASQTMAIRRLVRGDAAKGHIAISRLLREIEKFPSAVPTPRLLQETGPIEDIAHSDRIDTFKRLSQVIAVADTVVAHIVPEDERIASTPLGTLDDAIDYLTDLFTKYSVLIAGSPWPVVDTYLIPDWRRTFAEPLFVDHDGWFRTRSRPVRPDPA